MSPSQNTGPANAISRASMIAATVLLAIVVLLVCLIPKAENDLFFELRTGMDILATHRLPHVDTYSWTNRGTRWDVPEWLAFVCYSLAYQAAGFFGTWLLMASLTVGAVFVAWFWLAPKLGIAWAFLMANLTLLGMNECIQERPYAFTYLLLAVSLVLLTHARRRGAPAGKSLIWLPALCVLWANLHQGVLVFVCILTAYAAADAAMCVWARRRGSADAADHARRAGRMLAAALACALAAMVSPYGWRIYWNVLITLRDRHLMSSVTEWKPVTVLPLAQLQPFILISILVFGALALSRRRSVPDFVVVACLFVEALLHARNIALLAVGGIVIAGPHLESCIRWMRERLWGASASRSLSRSLVLIFGGLMYAATVALVAVATLEKAVGPKGYGAEGIGEAVARVPSYPEDACAFMDRAGFPSDLRLLNNFEIGGYLMWRRPRQPVFVDGRLDVYVGQTFDDMLMLSRGGSPGWARLSQKYDFDCVVTTSPREAKPFLTDPDWALVYLDPKRAHHLRCRILLRRRPLFAPLIAKCLGDRPSAP